MSKSESFLILEHWLVVLISSYRVNPNLALLKAIIYYLERITHHEDYLQSNQQQDYISAKRYWLWLKNSYSS